MSASAFPLNHEVYAATAAHIVRVDKLGDVVPRLKVERPGALLLSLAMHGDKLYWSEEGSTQIFRSNLDGTEVETWLSGYGEPSGLSIDPITERLFWYHDARIYRAALNGTTVEYFTADRPVGALAVDPGQERVYWIERDTGGIMRAEFGGSSVENITPPGLTFEGPHMFPFSLTLAPDTVYFSGGLYGGVTIYEMDRQGTYLAGLPVGYGHVVMALCFNEQEGMLYWHQMRLDTLQQPLSIHRFAPASSLQETVVYSSDYTPGNFTYDNFTVLFRRQFVVQSQGTQTTVWFPDVEGIRAKGLAVVEVITEASRYVSDMKLVAEAGTPSGRIYFTETVNWPFEGVISRVDTDGANRQVLRSDLTSIFGIEVDEKNNFLYWSESLSQRIFRSDLDGNDAAAFANTPAGLGFPMGLSLDRAANKLYCAFVDFNSGAIGAFDLDTAAFEVVAHLDQGAFAVTVDPSSRNIYYADEATRVYRVGMDDLVEELVPEFRGANIVLDAIGGHIYGSHWDRLNRANPDGTEVVILGALPVNASIIALKARPYSITILGPPEVNVGKPVTLRAGSLPTLVGLVTYEWYKDGVLIAGAGQTHYTIPSVSHADAGEYQLRITDQSKGIYVSAPFVLTVVDALPVGRFTGFTVVLCILFLLGIFAGASGARVFTLSGSRAQRKSKRTISEQR